MLTLPWGFHGYSTPCAATPLCWIMTGFSNTSRPRKSFQRSGRTSQPTTGTRHAFRPLFIAGFAGLIGGLAAGAVDIDIDAFLVHLGREGEVVKPAKLCANGLYNHFTGRKKYTITCGECSHRWPEKVPFTVDTASALCPCCKVQNTWSHSLWLKRYLEAKAIGW